MAIGNSRIVLIGLVTLRLVVGGIFIWAGLAKMPEFELFEQVVRSYDFIPEPLAVPAALALPWIEVSTGLCLVIGLWIRYSAMIVVLLMLSFMGAMAWGLYHGADVPCGCFGFYDDFRDVSIVEALVRNTLILVAASGLVFARQVPLPMKEAI
ncbi:MAG: DoxX family membrane protein [Gemmatimonadetes bacterium]|nr:DoxX family membrane protein [Gemmatimonadota bacterium]